MATVGPLTYEQNPSNHEADVLSSLAYYEQLRSTAMNVRREEGSHLDIVTLDNGDEVPIAHMAAMLMLNFREKHHRLSYDSLFSVTKAVQDLNSGNGAFVPAVQGLNERCPIRFTLEGAATLAKAGVTLGTMIEMMGREPGVERLPTGFIGAFASSVSGSSSLVSGLLGYPQISGSSTSTELDNKEDHPMFGRTVPAEDGNAIPLILYFKQVMKVQNLVLVMDNSSYGNSYADAMRRAAEKYAPEMKLLHIPIDNGKGDDLAAIQAALGTVRDSEIRYIFTGARRSLLPELFTEAYNQGMIGDGSDYVWIGGAGYDNPTELSRYEPDDPMYHAFQGTGNVEFVPGLRGDPVYDGFLESLSTLRNPVDIQWMKDHVYPTNVDYDYPDWLADPTFMTPPAITNFATFFYEATIALGLSACAAVTDDLVLTGEAHYQAFKALNFDTISGIARFDNATGSRDPTGLLYKATNYVQETKEDGGLGFKGVITHLFNDGEWSSQQEEYVFSDGTTNPPPQLTPPEESSDDEWLVPVVAGVAALMVILVALILFFLYERKKRKNDGIQKVKKSEIAYSDPPEVLGRGVFGLVLLGEYRGTKVATKQIVPFTEAGDTSVSSGMSSSIHSTNSSSNDNSSQAGDRSGYYVSMSGHASGTHSTSTARQWKAGKQAGIMGGKSGGSKSKAFSKTKQKKILTDEIMAEMKVLAKLRHPCVTTFMGLVTEKDETPMLVMEWLQYGAFYDVLHNKTVVVDGEIILPILRDIAQGVRFLHQATPTFIHGDLKSANILLDSNFRAKVADFGLSDKKNVATGTPFWMAPELLRKETVNTTMTDAFSFGVILYEVYSRKEPYEGEFGEEVLRLVADEKIQKRPGIPEHMPDPLKSIMADCLVEEPERRPPFEEIDTRLQRLTVQESTPTNLKTVGRSKNYDHFPPHIAKALEEGHRPESEHKDCVTIFMADIVGFEQMSASWSEEKVQDLLHRFHDRLDELCKNHQIQRIKTVGVSYMAVANLFDDQMNDHAKRIADFAKQALQVAGETYLDDSDPLLGTVALRIGIHSGPAIAGVVGTRTPRYSLFGDAVNTSMCMESTSEVDRISLSKATADILMEQEPSLEVEDRGLVRISRKGKMHCFWLGATNAANDAYKRIMAKKQSRMIRGSTSSSQIEPAPEQAPEQAPPVAQTPMADEEAPPVDPSLDAIHEDAEDPVQESFDSEYAGDDANV